MDIDEKIQEFYEGVKDNKANIRDICSHMKWMKSQLDGLVDVVQQLNIHWPTFESCLTNVEQNTMQISSFTSCLGSRLGEVEVNTQALEAQIVDVENAMRKLEGMEQITYQNSSQVSYLDICLDDAKEKL